MDAVILFLGPAGFPYVLSRPQTGTTQDGLWQVTANLQQVLHDGRFLSGLSCAGGLNELHVCAVDWDGILVHVMRDNTGGWSPYDDVRRLISRRKHSVRSPVPVATACATDSSGQLHLCMVDSRGGLFHTIRTASGTWPFPLGDVRQQIVGNGHPSIGPVKTVACAVNDVDELHVLALDGAGTLWQTMRLANGTWPFAFFDVQANLHPVGGIGPLSSIACANDANNLHVCAVDVQTSRLWHTIRDSSGNWPFPFGDVQSQAGTVAGSTAGAGAAPIVSTACAASSARLHVLAIANDPRFGRILGYTIRESGGTWQAFGNITQQANLPHGGFVDPTQCSTTSG